MPRDIDQITNLEAEIDALDSPTTEDVLAFSDDYDAGIVAASALRRSLSPGGGSQPEGIVQTAQVLVTETAGAGTYEAAVEVEEGTIVLDVIVYNLAVWDADTCEYSVTDATQAYYAGRGLTTAYDPTNLALGNNYATLGTSDGENYQGAAWVQNAVGANPPGPGVRYTAADTITCSVVTTGEGGATGRMLFVIVMFTPIMPTAAVKS